MNNRWLSGTILNLSGIVLVGAVVGCSSSSDPTEGARKESASPILPANEEENEQNEECENCDEGGPILNEDGGNSGSGGMDWIYSERGGDDCSDGGSPPETGAGGNPPETGDGGDDCGEDCDPPLGEGGSDAEGGCSGEGGSPPEQPYCGDGHVDPGEQCDPQTQAGELCFNGMDDDGDGQTDCDDPDCEIERSWCNSDCQIVTAEACKPILKDPAKLCRVDGNPDSATYHIHGRAVPNGLLDPTETGVQVALFYGDNPEAFFMQSIPGSEIVALGSSGRRWKYSATTEYGITDILIRKSSTTSLNLNFTIDGQFPFEWSDYELDIVQQVSFGDESFYTDHVWLDGAHCLTLPSQFFK